MEKYWNDDHTVTGESCMFLGSDAARLMFPPARILRVYDSDGLRDYVEGQDYAMNPEGLTRLPGSRMPLVTADDMYMDPGNVILYNQPGHVAIAGGPCGKAIRFSLSSWYPQHQVVVDYTARNIDFPAPVMVGNRFRDLIAARLRKGTPVVITCVGDSISAGYNSSAFCKSAPWQPGYPELVAEELRRVYGIAVDLRNHAISGTGIRNALEIQEKWIDDKPDLMIIAYGMNNFSNMTAEQFLDELKAIIAKAREARPDTLFLVVSSMAGNAEWEHTPPEPAAAYSRVLRQFTESTADIGFADVYPVWEALVARKGYYSVAGNGVNHPNDFGFRVYAQVVLNQLVPGSRYI